MLTGITNHTHTPTKLDIFIDIRNELNPDKLILLDTLVMDLWTTVALVHILRWTMSTVAWEVCVQSPPTMPLEVVLDIVQSLLTAC